MTVFNFIKFVFIMVALTGLVFIGVGAWKMEAAHQFAKTAQKVQGTFAGYHEVLQDPTVMHNDSLKRKVRSTYPMFTYTDAQGRTHHITGNDVVVFQRLKSGDRVRILVSPHDPENARLGSVYYLYGGGGFLVIAGLIVILLFLHGLKALAHCIGPSAAAAQTSFMGGLQRFCQSTLPVGDFVIIAGGFVLVAGAMIGLGTHFFLKRQDPALIRAMEAGRFDEARLLAIEGRGIEGKNAANEPALIAALKANRPKVARAILRHWNTTNVVTSKGESGLSLAAANGDHITLAMMIKKGAETFGLNPSIVHDLIAKGDTETLDVIFSSTFALDAEYMRLTYGDHAVMHAKPDVVRLIQKHNGPFTAPPSFVALVLEDMDGLASALKKPDACRKNFDGTTLMQFAETIGKKALIDKAGGCL